VRSGEYSARGAALPPSENCSSACSGIDVGRLDTGLVCCTLGAREPQHIDLTDAKKPAISKREQCAANVLVASSFCARKWFAVGERAGEMDNVRCLKNKAPDR
jgi:hypothetical protein